MNRSTVAQRWNLDLIEENYKRWQADPRSVDTLLICSGRVSWDLMVERGKQEQGGRFAIGRVEQLYPQPLDDIKHEIARYPNLKRVRWVQDEPRNMGPWPNYALNVWPHVDAQVEVSAVLGL